MSTNHLSRLVGVTGNLVRRSYSSSVCDHVTIYGAYGSPYTRKVESALRYKRVPVVKKHLMPGNLDGAWDALNMQHIKPKVIPVVQFPDGSFKNDSTYILQEVDQRYPERPILPSNPGDRFLSLLLEDMFDEWGTKIMFGIRWMDKLDQDWSGSWLAMDSMMGTGKQLDQVAEFGKVFGSRQVERMGLVGCKDRETVYRSLEFFAAALNSHLQKGSMFLLGSTPSVADFALYGQFSQLVIDVSPDRILRERYPAVWAWVRKLEDTSGVEEAHYEDDQGCLEFIRFAGNTYLPFLEANSNALQSGGDTVSVEILEGIQHQQPVFKYQAKCFKVLKEEYSKLSGEDLAMVNAKLKTHDALKFFQ